MKIMGVFYRDWLSSEGLLDKAGCSQSSQTYFWADTDQRTVETARALAEGILPGCEIEPHAHEAGAKDPLFQAAEAGPGKLDPKLALAAIAGRIGPDLNALVQVYRPELQVLQRLLNGNAKAAKSIFDEPMALTATQGNVSMTGPLALASTLTENFLLEYTDGLDGERLGWGRLSTDDLQQLLLLHTAYADLMRRTPYLAQVRGSNLLHHVLLTMEQSATGKPTKGALGPRGARLVVLVGHDTNLSNLSGMLDLSWTLPSHQRDDTPPGGALIFSLWKSTNGEYLVRVQFVAQTLAQMHKATPLTIKDPPIIANLFLPGCSQATDGYPCTWPAFSQIAKRSILTQFIENDR